VIEVEAAQVVLIGLALTTVLADDDPRHRLEHLTCPHHGTGRELTRGDRTLARGLGDPHQVLGRILGVGQVDKGSLARHQHVGAERQVHDRIDAHAAVRRNRDLPPGAGEVDQAEDQPARSRRAHVESINALRIGVGRLHTTGVARELDRDPGQRTAGFVADGPADLRRARRACGDRPAQNGESQITFAPEAGHLQGLARHRRKSG
jgi:hypothetical protein